MRWRLTRFAGRVSWVGVFLGEIIFYERQKVCSLASVSADDSIFCGDVQLAWCASGKCLYQLSEQGESELATGSKNAVSEAKELR